MSRPAPLFQSVDCVRLSVSDLEAGLRFYRDLLGHQMIWRTRDSVGLRMPNAEAEIVLHLEPRAPEIDIKVDSADDAASRIESAGGRVVVPPFDIRVGRCAVVQDPWGNELVVLDFSRGLLVTDSEGNVTGNSPPRESAISSTALGGSEWSR